MTDEEILRLAIDEGEYRAGWEAVLVREIVRLKAEVERLKGLTWCAYCGAEFPLDGDAREIGEHIKSCEKHPISQIKAEVERMTRDRDFYHAACVKQSHEVEQVLGKALGYPDLYPDGSSVDDGAVCVGDHVPTSLADEAADRIVRQEALLRRSLAIIADAIIHGMPVTPEVAAVRNEIVMSANAKNRPAASIDKATGR